MPATKMNLPLSPETHTAIFGEARRRGLPATRLVRSILEDWLREQRKARLGDEIRRFAERHAGSEVDLSPAFEDAAVAELRRLNNDEAR